MRFTVRMKMGLYTARFRRSSVDIHVAERKRRYRPKDDKINSQNQGQMGPETNVLIQCTLYEGTIRPVLFSLILLFLSDSGLRLGEFKCLTSSLFYHNNAGADSRRGKTVCRSENITGRK